MTQAADDYMLDKTTRPIKEFIDDLSNWYVRRSRRRFWKSDSDEDKDQAYQTLHYVLVSLSQLMAPWVPFTAEHTYQELSTASKNLPRSVHLCSWPNAGNINDKIIDEMAKIRQVVVEGLAQRAEVSIKVRQPLASISVVTKSTISKQNLSIIEEELNVKKVDYAIGSSELIKLDIKITTELAQEGLVRDVIRRIQNLRKKSGLDVEDRINLSITGPKIYPILVKFDDLIKKEVLAKTLNKEQYEFSDKIKIDETEITISLQKSQ
jgi:isoleucyl-tRNA synthetase